MPYAIKISYLAENFELELQISVQKKVFPSIFIETGQLLIDRNCCVSFS
jgi:hypothetical protein